MAVLGAPLALYQIHHTDAMKTEAALKAVLLKIKSLQSQGLIFRFGLCNATVWQVQLALDLGLDVFSVQNEFSLFNREAEKPFHAGHAASSKKNMLPYW